MPEHDPEQELGPKFASAFQDRSATSELRGAGLAAVARKRVRRRRRALNGVAASVLVVVAVGGAWSVLGSGGTPTNSAGSAEVPTAAKDNRTQGIAPSYEADTACPTDHPIKGVEEAGAVPAGLDVSTPVTGLQACRYQVPGGEVLGHERFDAKVAQQVVDAIKVLPERNPALPVFKCAPEAARPTEAIALRFSTAAGIREIWVEYTGCTTPGFFTGSRTYGLFAAPLKLFMTGSVRPSGSTYLNALTGW
ncbi:hypothetical protein HPO96_18950 [Kribbella sandramycini]|uniref:Uncharacterized protein n=1 Tax=Kribbella sandramycini TaxID=60450 RepID=A0A7Y4L103_9ACTN|nr:hypothetical protein [Kribbella sandramycini]MBB6564626.1 hypothetical protein [Kribbella sandramycini]NOL42330.1 hypothetical protein [Kribbella sandramycini]